MQIIQKGCYQNRCYNFLCLLYRPMLQLTERQRQHVEAKVVHVCSYLETYYAFLEEYQNGHHPDGKYRPVDGQWNPLQIMRNRRIRATQNTQLKDMEVSKSDVNLRIENRMFEGISTFNINSNPWQKVKLASRVFSRHSRPRNIWQVNLHEIRGDLFWREDHWLELKDHSGQLWFNEDGSLREKLPSQEVRQTRLHDGLFIDRDDSGSFGKSSGSLVGKKYSHSGSNSVSTKGGLNLNLTPDSKSNKSLFSNERLLDQHDYEPNNNDKPDSAVDKVNLQSSSSKPSSDAIFDDYHKTQDDSNHHSASESDDEDDAVDFMNFLRNTEMKITSKGRKMDVGKFNSVSMVDSLTSEMKQKMERYQRLEEVCNERCSELSAQMDMIDSELNRRNTLNDTTENKIEELLGFCDRTNGDINTSITLQIRNLIEKSSELNQGIETSWLLGILSKTVETLIIAALWLVWTVVESWIIIRTVIMGLIRVVKWALF